MLDRPDIVASLGQLGYAPREFYDDSIYHLLEQPLPALCADRLDYFLRDGLACGVVKLEAASRILNHVAVWNDRIILTDLAVAREAVALFQAMNQDWWASPTEAFIYNEFAEALREGLRLGILRPEDLMTEDDLVLAKLDAAENPDIARTLAQIRHFRPQLAEGYCPRVVPKQRWLDPHVRSGRSVARLSST
jgi:HD superfamily phosphohydrolase